MKKPIKDPEAKSDYTAGMQHDSSKLSKSSPKLFRKQQRRGGLIPGSEAIKGLEDIALAGALSRVSFDNSPVTVEPRNNIPGNF